MGPSDKWLDSFIQRAHKEGARIKFGKPEIKAAYAVEQNTREVYDTLYTALSAGYDANLYSWKLVWSADESGKTTKEKVATVRKDSEDRKPGNPKLQLKDSYSGHVTVMAGGNAAGDSTAYMAIVSGKTVDAEMARDFPNDTLLRVSDSGSMTSAIMGEWIEHFAVCAQQVHPGPHLLIIDNVKMHWSREVIEQAWKRGIEIVFLPPHTTAKLQVLDVAIFQSFKAHFDQARTSQAKTQTGVNRSNIASLAIKALKQALKASSLINGFRTTGIFPLNRLAIPDNELRPSNTAQTQAAARDANSDPPAAESASSSSSSSIGDSKRASVPKLSDAPALLSQRPRASYAESLQTPLSLPAAPQADSDKSKRQPPRVKPAQHMTTQKLKELLSAKEAEQKAKDDEKTRKAEAKQQKAEAKQQREREKQERKAAREAKKKEKEEQKAKKQAKAQAHEISRRSLTRAASSQALSQSSSCRWCCCCGCSRRA